MFAYGKSDDGKTTEELVLRWYEQTASPERRLEIQAMAEHSGKTVLEILLIGVARGKEQLAQPEESQAFIAKMDWQWQPYGPDPRHTQEDR